MGLDLVEFTVALEDTFRIALTDEEVQGLRTPGLLVAHLCERLGEGAPVACLEQRAFHRLRQACTRILDCARADVRPGTAWVELLAAPDLRSNWHTLQHACGVSMWPDLTLFGKLPANQTTVADTARWLATHVSGEFVGPGETWTRAQIEEVVRRLLDDLMGVTEFDWNDDFVRDLKLD